MPTNRRTLYASHRSTGVTHEGGWGDFFRDIASLPALVVDDPDARPAWAPYVLKPESGGRRLASNVDYYTALVLDLDDVPVDGAIECGRRLAALGIYACIHETWSHVRGGSTVRWRIIVPLSAPLSVSRAANAQNRLAFALQVEFDPKTKNPDRLYYLPCRKSNAPDPAFAFFPGKLLDVGTLLDPEYVSREAVATVARGMKRSHDPGISTIGSAIIASVQDGMPYATEGARDATAWRIACALHRAFPRADPLNLAALFDESTSLMGADAPNMRDKFMRAWDTGPRTVGADVMDRMREFWAQYDDPERREPYNSAERDAIVRAFGANPSWLLQAEDGCHILTHEGYTAGFGPRTLPVAMLKYLAPSPVSVVTASGDYLAPEVVAKQFGAHVRSVVWTLYERPLEEQWDHKRAILTLSGVKMRIQGPARSADVEEWLGAMMGPEAYDTVVNWLSLAPDLREILPALYLAGAPGAGKNGFANALARGWSEGGATQLDNALGQFTSAIVDCPVLLGDEVFPRDWRGNAKTPEFRSLVGERVHKWEAKYKNASKIIGCVRVILAANNDRMFRVGDHLTDHDIEAIAQRVIMIRIRPEGGRFLESLPDERRAHMFAEGFFRHVLYLALAPAQRVGRFGVQPIDSTFVDGMLVGTGARPLVCQWVVAQLETPVAGVDQAMRIADSVIWVRARGIFTHWDRHMYGSLRPTMGRLAQSVYAMCSAEPDHDGWAPFDVHKLEAWARDTRAIAPDRLGSLLSAPLPPVGAGATVIPLKKGGGA